MTEIRATNITWHEGHVTREARNKLLRQKGGTLWFTGLSGSGKSTFAYTLEHALIELQDVSVFRGEKLALDGITLRIGVGEPTVGDAVDHVLSKFKPGERKAIEEAIATAAQAALVWIRQGVEACMNRFNGGDDPKGEKKPRPLQKDR